MLRFFTIILLFLSVEAVAQSNITQQAQQMGNALIQKDYKSFVRFTYPTIMKEMGGAEKMAAAIEKQMKSMEQTAQILSVTYGEPSRIIKEGQELQCTLPQEMVLKTPQGKLCSKSTLICISTNEGQNWYFIDAGERDLNTVRVSLPNISRRLILPKPEAPQFVE